MDARRTGPIKFPTYARILDGALLLCLVSALFFAPGRAAAEPRDEASLHEAEVVKLARARAPGARLAQATEQLAEARARTSALAANPSLNYARETVETGPVSARGSQDILSASLPLEFARRGTARALIASESAWIRAEASLSRSDAVLAALYGYYDVVLAARHVEILSESVSNLEEAARVLKSREAAGTASGYESTRLAIEHELSRSQLAEARGVFESRKARLAALLGLDLQTLHVDGNVGLLAVSDEVRLARGGARPVLQRAKEAERFATEAQDQAKWAWLPSVELGAGVKRANNAGFDSGYGYALGVSLTLPLFDHGQAQRAEADAQQALTSARSEALTRSLDAEVAGALATLRVARQELERFEASTTHQVETLLKAAGAGYREGERSIVELLDAQRARTLVAERRLALLYAAKRAEATLRAAAGDFE
jgi:outer membrane protein TolC